MRATVKSARKGRKKQCTFKPLRQGRPTQRVASLPQSTCCHSTRCSLSQVHQSSTHLLRRHFSSRLSSRQLRCSHLLRGGELRGHPILGQLVVQLVCAGLSRCGPRRTVVCMVWSVRANVAQHSQCHMESSAGGTISVNVSYLTWHLLRLNPETANTLPHKHA